MMDSKQRAKPLVFIASSREAIREMPDEVRDRFGFALWEAQRGRKPDAATPLKGFGGASVLEVIEDYERDTYRAVYTVRFAGVVYVLHVFQKKSRHGVGTPRQDLALIEQRLKEAEYHYHQVLLANGDEQ